MDLYVLQTTFLIVDAGLPESLFQLFMCFEIFFVN